MAVATINIEFVPAFDRLYATARLRCIASCRDESGALFDPTTVKLNVQRTNPDNSIASVSKFTFGVDPEIVKDATGIYHYESTPALPGAILFQWTGESVAIGKAIAERGVTIAQPTEI